MYNKLDNLSLPRPPPPQKKKLPVYKNQNFNKNERPTRHLVQKNREKVTILRNKKSNSRIKTRNIFLNLKNENPTFHMKKTPKR
jgi:hypothetical protein